MARDGDRSKRYALSIPVWETFRDGMLEEKMRFKVRELWREEMKYRSILDDRDKRLAIALARSRKQNLRHTKRKIRMSREARIARLCTPEGRMEEARKLHGIDLIDKEMSGDKVDPGVRRKLLGLSSPPEPDKPKPTIHKLPPQKIPEPEPPPIPPRDYFGRCADDGGRAWWENLLVKKKRPTREELALLPYDISKDIEDSNQMSSFGVGEGFSGEFVHLENGFLPFVGEAKIIQNTTVGNAEQALSNPHAKSVPKARSVHDSSDNLNAVISSPPRQKKENQQLRPQTAVSLPQHHLIPILRPSSAPAVDSEQIVNFP